MSVSFDGKKRIVIETESDIQNEFLLLRGEDCDIDIKKHREKRSLNANAMSWSLTDKLANEMTVRGAILTKEEMHAEMVFRYGQPMLDEKGQAMIYSTAQNVDMKNFYPYAREIGNSELNGKMFTHYKIYRGTSDYDTREMYIFLQGVIQECKEQGIETLSERELSLLEVNHEQVFAKAAGSD